MTAEQKEIEKLKIELQTQKVENRLVLILAGMPLPKNGLPAEVNILCGKEIIQQEMANESLILTFNEGGYPILRQVKDGANLDYYVNNKKIDLSDYIANTLTSKKFIQEKDGERQDNGAGNSSQQQQQRYPSNLLAVAENGIRPNQAVIDEGRAYLAELEGLGY